LVDKIFIKSFLHSSVLLQLVLGNRDHSKAECKARDQSFLCCDFTIAILAPFGSPSVLKDPHICAFDVVPANHLNDVITLKLEAILGTEINASAVGQEIGVHLEHGEDRTILDYLALDALSALSNTVVYHSEYVLILATRVGQEMVFRARSGFLIAALFNEALAFSVVQHFYHVSTLAALSSSITLEEFVHRESDLLLRSHADAVLSGANRSHRIA